MELVSIEVAATLFPNILPHDNEFLNLGKFSDF
jgi:hypothetical protein